jgi:hypothetical protein
LCANSARARPPRSAGCPPGCLLRSRSGRRPECIKLGVGPAGRRQHSHSGSYFPASIEPRRTARRRRLGAGGDPAGLGRCCRPGPAAPGRRGGARPARPAAPSEGCLRFLGQGPAPARYPGRAGLADEVPAARHWRCPLPPPRPSPLADVPTVIRLRTAADALDDGAEAIMSLLDFPFRAGSVALPPRSRRHAERGLARSTLRPASSAERHSSYSV